VAASEKVEDASSRVSQTVHSTPCHQPTMNNMSSPLSVKRRKLNENTTKLARPFVSPLRKSKPAPEAEAENAPPATTTPYRPSILAHSIILTTSPPDTAKRTSEASKVSPAKSTPVRKQQAFTTSSKRTDPAELAAQRAITKLELQIRNVKNELDALKQASQITSTTTDAELEVLAQKWKAASQTAAEELFGSVKERVNRMGGVAAWRETEKKKYDRSHGLGEFKEEPEEDDDADCEFDSQGEELPEAEQEYRRAQKQKAKKEMMEAADIEEPVREEAENGKEKLVWQEPGGDDDVSMVRSIETRDKLTLYRLSRWT